MMQQHKRIYRKLIALWLVLWGVISPTRAVLQTNRSSSWGYEPTYQSINSSNKKSATGTSGYGNTSYSGFSSGRAYTPQFSGDICPSYHFQSTSPYRSVSEQSFGFTILSEPLRDNIWGEEETVDPEDNPIGVLPNPTPIGEPLVLLLFAVLYLVVKLVVQHQSKRKAEVE